jgi:hypothetical protein
MAIYQEIEEIGEKIWASVWNGTMLLTPAD